MVVLVVGELEISFEIWRERDIESGEDKKGKQKRIEGEIEEEEG